VKTKRTSRIRVRLIHWKGSDAVVLGQRLTAAGYEVDDEGRHGDRANPPAVFVIDLSRRPSQGRDLGISLRISKATRNVPLIFLGGEAEKVERVRSHLPDASFCSLSTALRVVKRALAAPPSDPVVPKSVFAPFADTALLVKLGIREAMTVALIGAPKSCRATLGELPPGAKLVEGARPGVDLALWFVTDRARLERGIKSHGAIASGLWVLWPKRGSPVESELTQQIVRRTGLDRGLVDFKVVAFDETWTAYASSAGRSRADAVLHKGLFLARVFREKLGELAQDGFGVRV